MLPFVAAGALGFAAPSMNVSTNGTYSVDRAVLFAKFSAAAYCDVDSINAWSCEPCKAADPAFTAKAFLNETTSMQAFVGTGDGYVVVSFRGTDDITDWLYNLQFPKVAAYPKCDGRLLGKCRVEVGFYKGWLSIKDPVIDEVKRVLKQGDQLFITGHSLGAALAAHCAVELGASIVQAICDMLGEQRVESLWLIR